MVSRLFTRGETFTEAARLAVESCHACGILFAMPADFMDARRRDHENFCCPRGHSLAYKGPTPDQVELERARRALADEREYAAQQAAEMRREVRSHAATKGKLTRERKRAMAGVCPACNRHFTALERHMHTQHPEFGVAE